MQIDNFYKELFYRFMENLLILLAGIVFAIALLATICGDGNKGIVDLL